MRVRRLAGHGPRRMLEQQRRIHALANRLPNAGSNTQRRGEQWRSPPVIHPAEQRQGPRGLAAGLTGWGQAGQGVLQGQRLPQFSQLQRGVQDLAHQRGQVAR